MPNIQIAIDEVDLAELRRALQPDQIPKAIVSAANKTTAKVRTQVIRGIKDNVPFSLSVVREQVSIQKATRATMEAFVKVSYKPIPLYDYRPIQTKRGVVVRTAKVGPAQLFRHYFIAKMPTGHVGVFMRKPGAKSKVVDIRNGRKIYSALPIKEAFGPSLTGVFTGVPGLIETQREFAATDLQKQVKSQIDRFMAVNAAADDNSE